MGFDRPYLLLTLLTVPAAAMVAAVAGRRASRHAVVYPNLAVLASVRDAGRSWRRLAVGGLVLVALATAGIATASPRLDLTTTSERATVILVIDTSRSMQSDDVKPTRLAAAKTAAQGFLDRVPERLRVGLVLFSGYTTVAAVPTREHQVVRAAIAGIDPLTSPGGGTAIGDAVAHAVELGQFAVAGDARPGAAIEPGLTRDVVSVVFLSDGRQNRGILPPLEGARQAKAAEIPVHTFALGSRSTVATDPTGFGFRRAPDPDTLRAISALTGGEFTEAQSAEKLERAYADLGSRIGRAPERVEVTAGFVAAAAVALSAAGLLAAVVAPRLP